VREAPARPGLSRRIARSTSRYGHTTRFFTIAINTPAGARKRGVSGGHSSSAAAYSPGRGGALDGGALVAVPLVEVNGIEPSTSCLQSRRSPD
jgi:hypothetical protein